MNNFSFHSPTKVIFGKGVADKIGAETKAWGGTKVLIHYGGGSVVRSGLLDRVKKSLDEAGIAHVELGGAVPNPRLGLVYKGIDLCRKEGVDFVLGIGGGSAIDSAKAIAVGVPYKGDVWDIYLHKVSAQAALPHANIITLAATGTETSSSSVITNEEGWLKRGNNTQFNRPCFTLMDPELLYTLPPYQTACGVVDIMMHTMDRYFSHGGTNEITDRIAEVILRTVVQYGKICMEEPENYEARSEVMWAGSLSHNHLTGLGLPGDWAPHQIEHELGGMFDVAHGAGLAAIWNSWASYVYDADPMRFARFGVNVWGLDMNWQDPAVTAREAIRRTVEFFRSIDMPTTTTELLGRETTEEEMKELAVKCTYFGARTVGNMKVLGEKEILEVYRGAR